MSRNLNYGNKIYAISMIVGLTRYNELFKNIAKCVIIRMSTTKYI